MIHVHIIFNQWTDIDKWCKSALQEIISYNVIFAISSSSHEKSQSLLASGNANV
jgi:hypothetical protein